MKRIVIFLALYIGISQLAISQIKESFSKNNIITGGAFSFNHQKRTYPDNSDSRTIYNNFETDCHLGYYILNHFAAGLKTNITIRSQKRYFNSDVVKINDNWFTIGPFLRYSTNFNLFIETGGGFEFFKEDVVSDNTNSSNWKANFYNIGVGYSLFLSNSVAIEPMIRYKHYHLPNQDTFVEFTDNNIDFLLGFQIYL
jgi:hypothetical protein